MEKVVDKRLRYSMEKEPKVEIYANVIKPSNNLQVYISKTSHKVRVSYASKCKSFYWSIYDGFDLSVEVIYSTINIVQLDKTYYFFKNNRYYTTYYIMIYILPAYL